MSPRRVITASPPGRSSPASEAISRSMLCIHSSLGELDASMWIVLGRISMRLAGGRVLEAHGPADQAGGRATLAVAKDLVAIADDLTLEVENPRRGSPRFAAQDVAVPVRHEREVSELDPVPLLLPGLEPEPARGDHVKPEVPRHRRQRESPGCGELGAAVVRAVHPQEVQCLAEGIRRREGVGRFHERAVCMVVPASSSAAGRSSMYSLVLVIDSPALCARHWTPCINDQIGATMAYVGQTLENPASGERITFRQTSADTGGELLCDRPRTSREPAGPGWPAHPPEPGGALRGRRGHDALQDGAQAGRRGARRGGRRPRLVRSTTSRMSATATRSSASRCARH